MRQQAANPAADTADPVSNAVVSPEASLLLRQILQSALKNQGGTPANWVAEAQALLANVLMNDYLNWWNLAFPVDVADAQAAVDYVTQLNPPPPDPVRAQAYHAQGLIYRADRTPQKQRLARDAFNQARQLDPGFARAHAQFGNQKSLLGRESEAHAPLDRARNLSPRHPASGYFYWAEGRAYFQEGIWSNAINWLKKSVEALPTVWYNRCYLAAAQNSAGDQTGARRTMTDFINAPGFDPATFTRIKQLKPDPNDPARKRVLDFVQPLLP
jgi:tetratricopeptide (TPR) repeat protein